MVRCEKLTVSAEEATSLTTVGCSDNLQWIYVCACAAERVTIFPFRKKKKIGNNVSSESELASQYFQFRGLFYLFIQTYCMTTLTLLKICFILLLLRWAYQKYIYVSNLTKTKS